MTLPVTHLLCAAVAPLTTSGGFGRLGIDYPGARSSDSTRPDSRSFSQRRVEPLPSAVDSLPLEVVADDLSRRELISQESPSAAALKDAKDGTEDLTGGGDPRSFSLCGRRGVLH